MTPLAPSLQAWFTDRPITQRNCSPQTIAAYRDTFRLLLCFAHEQTAKQPFELDLSDLDAPLIGAFLNHLEHDRANGPRTRNARLGAIHSFYRFAALEQPEHAATIARVMAIPTKRHERNTVSYLDLPELKALLAAPDTTTWLGRRDHALLLVMIQTGVRVSELVGLHVGDVQMGTGPHCRVTGKGRKKRSPTLTAETVTILRVYRLSSRQIVELLGEMFGTTVSVGAVNATIMRMSAVLADPWRELRDAVRKAQAVHMDETSWRLRGETNWLWVAASALMACYRIDPSRSQAAAKELLGEDFGSFIITDRYAGYHWLDVLQQQLCWCHAIRQFVSLSEREGAPGRLGEDLLKAARSVIAAHCEYLQDGHDLTWLEAQLRPLRKETQALLERGVRGRHPSVLRRPAGRVRRPLDLLRGRMDRPDEQPG